MPVGTMATRRCSSAPRVSSPCIETALQVAVIFAFQPGEEGYAGARLMIEEGLLDRYGTPDAAFAIHISPRHPSGEVFTRPGTLMAGAGVFRIIIKGRAGHPAEPHHALDPIPIASEVVLALQTYVTRRVKAFEPAVVTVTAIQAGSHEVGAIPETATLTGTIRAVSEETLRAPIQRSSTNSQ